MISTARLLGAVLLATFATAAPTQELKVPEDINDPNWLPRNGNFSVPRNYDVGMQKRAAECSSLEARSDTDVLVKVYDNSIMAWATWFHQDAVDGVYPTSPTTFTNLWNDVVAASCNDAECDKHIGKAETARYYHTHTGTLEMWLEGEFFGEERRDNLVGLLRQAFDRAIVRDQQTEKAMAEFGPKDLFAKHTNGDSLRMVMRTPQESEEGCGDIISRVLSLGELISPIFGLVSIACATAAKDN